MSHNDTRKKLDFRDPMLIILIILLIFLTMGTAIGGCTSNKQITIVLDAAYGGDQPGYEGIVKEADVTQAIVEALSTKLQEDDHFAVQLTHEKGQAATVTERAEVINKIHPDLVLSIHAGGNPNPEQSGQKIYADIPTDSANKVSLAAAQTIGREFAADGWNVFMGYMYYEPFDENTYSILNVDADDTTEYQYDTWDIMKASEAPVVVSDSFRVTNQADVDRWANEEGYKKAADLYYTALKKYYGIE